MNNEKKKRTTKKKKQTGITAVLGAGRVFFDRFIIINILYTKSQH
jgi:hypothetical protein